MLAFSFYLSGMSTSFPDGLKRTAAMVVLRHADSFLLLRRNKPPNAGRYVPVGGKVDPHEDPRTTARRETREETGIDLPDTALHYGGTLVETSPVDYNWWCHIYLADIDYQPPPPCDEGTLEWIAFDRLPELPTPPTDWHIYQLLKDQRPFALNAIYDAELQLTSMVEEIRGERLI